MKRILLLAILGILLLSTISSGMSLSDTKNEDILKSNARGNYISSNENMTELEIDIIKNSRNRIWGFSIKNIGHCEAINITYNARFDGGIILFGRESYNLNDFSLLTDMEVKIGINPGRYYEPTCLVLGIGKTTMKICVNADNSEIVEETYDVILLVKFLFEI
jgi:hypothetical protein